MKKKKKKKKKKIIFDLFHSILLFNYIFNNIFLNNINISLSLREKKNEIK